MSDGLKHMCCALCSQWSDAISAALGPESCCAVSVNRATCGYQSQRLFARHILCVDPCPSGKHCCVHRGYEVVPDRVRTAGSRGEHPATAGHILQPRAGETGMCLGTGVGCTGAGVGVGVDVGDTGSRGVGVDAGCKACRNPLMALLYRNDKALLALLWCAVLFCAVPGIRIDRHTFSCTPPSPNNYAHLAIFFVYVPLHCS